jgi:hypothetical protein
MEISCSICNRQVDTSKEDVYVTVNWIGNDLIKKNNVKLNKKLSRVARICNTCWENTLKDKPKGTDYYWSFDKDV